MSRGAGRGQPAGRLPPAADPPRPLPAVFVQHIEAVREGHQSEGLRRFGGAFAPARCLTIAFKGRRKNLDLAAPTAEEAQRWVRGLAKLRARLDAMSQRERLDQYPARRLAGPTWGHESVRGGRWALRTPSRGEVGPWPSGVHSLSLSPLPLVLKTEDGDRASWLWGAPGPRRTAGWASSMEDSLLLWSGSPQAPIPRSPQSLVVVPNLSVTCRLGVVPNLSLVFPEHPHLDPLLPAPGRLQPGQ